MKKQVLGFALCLFTGLPLFAQYPRSAYFMESLPTRNKINPAFQPERGYFNVPVIGAFGTSVSSNALSIDNFIDILDDENAFLENDKFMNSLKDNNKINIDLHTDIISFGFYAGKGFWTVDLGVHSLINASLPKTMFEFARDADNPDNGKNYTIRNMQLYSDEYIDASVGYSQAINEQLTVGGKAKLLFGVANLNGKIDRMYIQSKNGEWDITSKGKMNISLKGLEPIYSKDPETGEDFLDDFDMDSPGLSGFGLGFDLGATYKLMDNLTLSASILDLGFISWSKSSTNSYKMKEHHIFSPEKYDDYGDSNGDGIIDEDEKTETRSSVDVIDLQLFQFRELPGKSRTTTLRSTLNIGGEYTIMENKIGFGLLSSTRFLLPKAYTELTASANFRPVRWFEGTFSYSFIHSNFKTFGLGLRFGPLFIGTDYMITQRYKNLKTANAYLGISIPLGKRKPADV